MFNTPIIIVVFKRYNETLCVFETIKKIKPRKLFIVADGPRSTQEKIDTDRTRSIFNKIDWECDVVRDYSETNLGCRERVSTGVSNAFKTLCDYEGVIILEDDCLPNESFYKFCEAMIEKYRYNNNIMHVSGVNFINKDLNRDSSDSYYFSKIAQIWGWATWKRAWVKYEENINSWPEYKETVEFKNKFPNTSTLQYFIYLFDRRYKNELTDWDIAWTYTCLKNSGLCIVPNINLIENIGSGTGATHKASSLLHYKSKEISFPLKHPRKTDYNIENDIRTYRIVFGIDNNFYNKVKSNIKKKLPFLFKYIKLLMK